MQESICNAGTERLWLLTHASNVTIPEWNSSKDVGIGIFHGPGKVIPPRKAPIPITLDEFFREIDFNPLMKKKDGLTTDPRILAAVEQIL